MTGAPSRSGTAELADEHAALRRLAELVVGGASQAEVLDTVVVEASRLVAVDNTTMIRYEPDGSSIVVAQHGAPAEVQVGYRGPAEGDGIASRIRRTGRPVRVDSYAGLTGGGPEMARRFGISESAGAPIVIESHVWGALTVVAWQHPLPPGIEQRLAQFAELVATAVSGAHARGVLGDVAHEQAALRRVAELVARGVAEQELFDAVAVEASKLIDDEATTLVRLDRPRAYTVVASCSGPAPVGTQIEVAHDDEGLVAHILQTRAPARLDDYGAMQGPAHARDDYGVGSSVGVPIIVEDRIWGILSATTEGRRLPVTAEHRLAQFAGLVAAALANAQARTDLQRLAEEQTALRRVAELVAGGVAPPQVFAAVAREASGLLDDRAMTLNRFESDRALVVVATCGGPAPVGTRITFEAETLPDWVRRGSRVVRVDDYTRERDAQLAVRFGLAAAVAAPIVVEGEAWGMLCATSGERPLPPGTEHRLQQFAKLVAAAIGNAQARGQAQQLADERAALLRVAGLVARGAALDEVFDAVATEASRLLGDSPAALLCFGPDGFATNVAACNSPAPLGLRVPSDGDTATGQVLRTGRAVRVESFEGTPLADIARRLGVGAGVAVPVTVEGRVWGSLTTSTPGPPPAPGSEERLAQFAELAAAAIANAENKGKLTASRARVVATADETRRRLQRDVHDSAQQRLVHTIIALKLAKARLAAGGAPGELVDEALQNAERANRELRDVVRGILPAALTRGGLRTGIESLVADLALPVDARVTATRLPAPTETTAYFIVAEALTNVVKHARATRASVEVVIEGDRLSIDVRDDGSGGADHTNGTGLIGLLDRVEASEGTLAIASPPGIGTTLHATLPLAEPARADSRR